jgi:hypothetical protein
MHRLGLERRKFVAVLSAWLGLLACDTSAVGVESCRQIEDARCSAASHCPGTFNITSPAACRRFYRDHCLHGLAIAQDPGAGVVNPCVNKIKLLGWCAEDHGQDKALIQDCRDGCSLDDVDPCGQGDFPKISRTANVCGLIRAPENIPECAFLNPTATTTESDSGS